MVRNLSKDKMKKNHDLCSKVSKITWASKKWNYLLIVPGGNYYLIIHTVSSPSPLQNGTLPLPPLPLKYRTSKYCHDDPGATSPKNLKKLLSLSEEGDKHIKTLRMDRSSKGDDTVASMMSSPPTSPGAKSSKRFRKLGIVNKMNNMSTGSLEPRQRRPLSPQRSDSGYGGSEAGSQSGRVEHDPRRRHTVGEYIYSINHPIDWYPPWKKKKKGKNNNICLYFRRCVMGPLSDTHHFISSDKHVGITICGRAF